MVSARGESFNQQDSEAAIPAAFRGGSASPGLCYASFST